MRRQVAYTSERVKGFSELGFVSCHSQAFLIGPDGQTALPWQTRLVAASDSPAGK